MSEANAGKLGALGVAPRTVAGMTPSASSMPIGAIGEPLGGERAATSAIRFGQWLARDLEHGHPELPPGAWQLRSAFVTSEAAVAFGLTLPAAGRAGLRVPIVGTHICAWEMRGVGPDVWLSLCRVNDPASTTIAYRNLTLDLTDEQGSVYAALRDDGYTPALARALCGDLLTERSRRRPSGSTDAHASWGPGRTWRRRGTFAL